jgi:hypothetical protein
MASSVASGHKVMTVHKIIFSELGFPPAENLAGTIAIQSY